MKASVSQIGRIIDKVVRETVEPMIISKHGRGRLNLISNK